MKIAIFAQEIRNTAGQTQYIATLIDSVVKRQNSTHFTIFTHKVVEPLTLPKNTDIVVLSRYYSYLLFLGNMNKSDEKYDMALVKGNFPYLRLAKRMSRMTLLVVHHLDSWKMPSKAVSKLKVLISNLLHPIFMRLADLPLTVTEELAESFNQKYKIRCVVLEDPISEDYFSLRPKVKDKKSQVVNLLSVGYFDFDFGRKGQDRLIYKLREVDTSLINYHIIFVGLQDEALARLYKIVRDCKLENRVSLLPEVSTQELIQLYRISDIYVTHTTYEGFYRQVIESFASGTPAVVFDSRDEVEDKSAVASVTHVLKSRGGELFKDSKSLTNSLLRVISEYNNYSENALNYARKFSSDVMSDKFLTLMANVGVKSGSLE